MTPVRSLKNQYLGINAHLHSQLQVGSGWPEFHTSHIVDMMRLMRAQLSPLGYTANIEQSLQIRRYGAPNYNPESDILIYDDDPARPFLSPQHRVGSVQANNLSIPIMLGLVEEDLRYHKAIGIYEARSRRDDRGEPVAWVELLSPSNKPGGQDARYYRDKRLRLIASGIVFVEIDYLHESPSTFPSVATYRKNGGAMDSEAHPYRIGVVDPRPDIEQGYGRLQQFNVDQPLPVVDIPLNDDDVLAFDFGPPYIKTFEEMLYGDEVDYSQLPLNFDRYREPDQARIVSRMIAVLEAAQAGHDLEQSPLPIETLPLAEGLRQLQAMSRENQ